MLTRLLSRGARKEQENASAAEEPPAIAAPTVAREGAPLLFVPVDGGMSFRLFSTNDEREAEAFVQDAFPGLGSKALFFEPLRPGMQVMDGEQVEVLVVINDTARPGTVYVSSFTDVQSAESFVEFEKRGGLDPGLVTVHRGVVQALETGPASGPYSTPVQVRREAAPTVAAPLSDAPVPQVEPVATVPIQPVPPKKLASVPSGVTAQKAPGSPAKTKSAATAAAAPKGAAGPRLGLVDSIKAWPGWDTLPERINVAATLKWQQYDEMKADPIALSQSRVMVAAAAAAGGVGAFWAGPVAVVMYAAAGFLGWLAAAHLTYWVGTVFFPGRKDAESKDLLFKVIGLCQAPRLILLVGFVLPVIGLVVPAMSVLLPFVVLSVLLWVLVAMVPATQYSLEIDRESATLTVLTSWLALFAISFVIPAVLV
jgi:hypothetical protein